MIREIKFRGLNAQGEMVYGDLSYDLPNSTDYYDEYPARICWHEGQASCNQPVKKGTVGQYTGLKDVNGVEIYEKDILSIPGWSTLEVAIDPLQGVCVKDGIHLYPIIDSIAEGDMPTVVGNIYQNPELMDGEK